VRKFFVEAKKPSVDIKGAESPAFQLRRYAWSAKLPLSIQLTAQRQRARIQSEKEGAWRQIAAAERRINQAVSKLYGLTTAELEIVEGYVRSGDKERTRDESKSC
jgi:hypothetical protein